MFTRIFTGKYLQVNVSCSELNDMLLLVYLRPPLPGSRLMQSEPHFYKLKESTKTFHLLQFIFIVDQENEEKLKIR